MALKPAHGTAGARRLTSARDLCANLKTVVEGLRLFPPGHVTVASYIERFNRCFTEFLEKEGAFTIEVTADSLLVDGHPVLTSETTADSLSNPLFLDGVTDISFLAETPLAELALLCEIWSLSVAADGDEGQTFTTRCWEASFNSIRVVSVDSFVEHLSADAERELHGLLQAIDEERSMGPTLPKAAAGRPRLGPSDLLRLRMNGLAEIESSDLDPGPAAQPINLAILTGEEARAMAAEVDSERAKQSLPAITALAFAGLEATAVQRAEIEGAIEAVFVSLARAAGLSQVRQTVANFVEAAQTDSDEPHRRFQALEIVLAGLGRPVFLSLALATLKGPAVDPEVAAILSFLSPAAAPALLDCIAAETQAVGELLMPRLLALKPRPDVLGSRIHRVPAYIAMALLEHATTFAEADRIATYIAAVAHKQPEIRHFAATKVPRANLLARPETLYPLVNDSDPGLRQLAISVVLTAKDNAVAPYLAQLLDLTDLPLPERRRVIRSLGSMPARESVMALRKEFRSQTNAETAATCALALARAGDEFSRPAIQDTANRLFVNADLKKGCLEAIRILDARKASATQQGKT